MRCADSSILYTLAQSYPKALYTIRAFAHALSYFNSCLNPYLYALLNRNFCFDLIDIIPSCLTCCKHSETFQTQISNAQTTIISASIKSNKSLFKKKLDNDDDDDEDNDQEIYYKETGEQTNVDVSCQIELLRI
jgi:hypothetical protein